MSGKPINLVGQRFSRLVVIEDSGKRGNRNVIWRCRCSCGNIKEIRSNHLKNGNTQSCGCLNDEKRQIQGRNLGLNMVTHGDSRKGRKARLYMIWCDMLSRCRNLKDSAYRYYGKKGTKIFPAWDNYATFRFWALCSGYGDDLCIHRIDNDGDYEPSNCTWMTKSDHTRLHNKKRWEARP